jgi:hypothetical protein
VDLLRSRRDASWRIAAPCRSDSNRRNLGTTPFGEQTGKTGVRSTRAQELRQQRRQLVRRSLEPPPPPPRPSFEEWRREYEYGWSKQHATTLQHRRSRAEQVERGDQHGNSHMPSKQSVVDDTEAQSVASSATVYRGVDVEIMVGLSGKGSRTQLDHP